MFLRALLNLWEHCGLAVRDPVPVIPAERARSVLGESVAVALAVRSPQKGREELDASRSLRHAGDRTLGVGRHDDPLWTCPRAQPRAPGGRGGAPARARLQ